MVCAGDFSPICEMPNEQVERKYAEIVSLGKFTHGKYAVARRIHIGSTSYVYKEIVS